MKVCKSALMAGGTIDNMIIINIIPQIGEGRIKFRPTSLEKESSILVSPSKGLVLHEKTF